MSEPVRLFADAWKLMVEQLPTPRIEESDGVATCFGNVPLIFFNASIVVRPAATADELRALLNETARRASACQHPSGVLLREDWLPAGWTDVIKERGLAPMVPMTGMEGAELLPARRPPAKLEILRVANDAMARDLAELNAQAYHMPVDSFECMANMRFWPADHYAYVGYLDGEPVSCAAALPVDGTVYVALVATLPEAQGKGYAETVMRRAVIEGQQAMGTTRTTLHASDMGLQVYRAMGYTPGPKLIFLGPAS
jgi:GNAT superfamily N-acetyltransferase